MREIEAILSALAAHPNESAVLATLVSVEGSSYRRPGARALFINGHRIGSISGGCLEEDLSLRAKSVLARSIPEVVYYDTMEENDVVWGVGLGCQGIVRVLLEPIKVERPSWMQTLRDNLPAQFPTTLTVTYGGDISNWGTTLAEDISVPEDSAAIFRETITPPPRLVIFGGGDDAQPLVRMVKEVGWHVTVVDARSAYANKARFPSADAIVVVPAGQASSHVSINGQTFVVLMTHRYTDDLNSLQSILPLGPAYLGILGPRKRTDRLITELQDQGMLVPPDLLARLYAPVGLDLGGTTPETVAVAILAEMLTCLSQRKPIHLRERLGSIHQESKAFAPTSLA